MCFVVCTPVTYCHVPTFQVVAALVTHRQQHRAIATVVRRWVAAEGSTRVDGDGDSRGGWDDAIHWTAPAPPAAAAATVVAGDVPVTAAAPHELSTFGPEYTVPLRADLDPPGGPTPAPPAIPAPLPPPRRVPTTATATAAGAARRAADSGTGTSLALAADDVHALAQTLARPLRVYVCGHSLGAALAALATLDLQVRGPVG